MANEDFSAYMQGPNSQGFNNYAAGNPIYGMGRSNPTSGPVDKLGYQQRDANAVSMRNAMLRRMQANQGGNYMSSASLTPQQQTVQQGMGAW
jgi:hypothetical protein